MKTLFYEDWYNKRVQKIINIFGQDWFAGKKILELGAAHGDIGFSFSKLGAEVTFTDLRQENLDSIDEKLKTVDARYKVKLLNQEQKYQFDEKFDLTLHLGTLYHIKNWKQDLECALETSNLMILETSVCSSSLPDHQIRSGISENATMRRYCGETPKLSAFCQESVEAHLNKIGCKFVRFDNSELNSNVSWNSKYLCRHVYDWNNDTNLIKNYSNNNFSVDVYFRRFWLVMSK